MRKILLLVILSVLLPFCSIIGQSKLDSVMLKISNQTDIEKVKSLQNLCFDNRFIDQSFALSCGEKALSIAQSLGDKSLEAKSLNFLGVAYKLSDNYQKALYVYVNALRVAQEARDTTQMGYAENNFAQAYFSKKFISLAIEHAEKANALFTAIDNKPGIAYTYLTLGDIHKFRKQFDTSLKYYNKCFSIRKSINDHTGELFVLNAIADVYFQQGNLDLSLEKYRLAEQEYLSLGENTGLIPTWAEIAAIHASKNNFATALNYLKKAFDLASKYSLQSALLNYGNDLAIAYAKAGEFETAINKIKETETLSDLLRNNFLRLRCYESYTIVYELMNNTQQALQYSRKAFDLKQQLNINENSTNTKEVEALYQEDNNFREQELIKAEVEMAAKERIVAIVVLLLVIVSAGGAYLLYAFKRKAAAKLKLENATKDRFFSIIAHDLKSPFKDIIERGELMLEHSGSMNFEKLGKEANLLAESSARGYLLLLNLLEWSRLQTGRLQLLPTKVKISEVVASVLELMKTFIDEKNIVILDTIESDMLVKVDSNCLNTIIRNLASNAIKFSRISSTIILDAYYEDQFVVISVKDSGIGISESNKKMLFSLETPLATEGTNGEKGTGLGLILVKEITKLNQGTITIDSKVNSGTTVSIKLPRP